MEKVRVQIEGMPETLTTTEGLLYSTAVRKARPEGFWLSSNIKYLERAYLPGAGGAYIPVYIVVTEQEPTVRTVTVPRTIGKQGVFRRVRLAFPYVVNVFVYDVSPGGLISLNLAWPLTFYRKLPLSGFSDELLVCNLPNVCTDPSFLPNKAAIGWTCFHGANPDSVSIAPYAPEGGKTGESEISAVSRLTDSVLETYWAAAFTGHEEPTLTAWNATRKVVSQCRSIAAWAQASENDPGFPLSVNWLPHPERANLGDVIWGIRDSIGVIPHSGFVNGEEQVIAPKGVVSGRRLHAILNRGTTLPAKAKLY